MFNIGDKVRVSGKGWSFDLEHKIDGQTGEIVAFYRDSGVLVKLDNPIVPTYDYCSFANYSSDEHDLYNCTSAQLELIESDFKVGDKVRITYNYTDWDKQHELAGQTGEIVKVNTDDYLVKLDNPTIPTFDKSLTAGYNSDKRDLYFSTGLNLEKISDFKFELGDTVEANQLSNQVYSITTQESGCRGEVVEILEDDEFRILINKHDDECRIGDDFIVESKYFDKTDKMFELGDTVKIIDDYVAFSDNVGRVGVILNCDTAESDFLYEIEFANGATDWVSEEDMKMFNGEMLQFKYGDRVQIVDTTGADSDYLDMIGYICEVDEVGPTELPYCVRFDEIEDWDWVNEDDIILVDEFEIGDTVQIGKLNLTEPLYNYGMVSVIDKVGKIVRLDDSYNTALIELDDDFNPWIKFKDLTLVSEDMLKSDVKFNIGDKVIIESLDSDEIYYSDLMEVYIDKTGVVKDVSYDYIDVTFGNGLTWCFHESDIRKFSDSELEVGDKVKILVIDTEDGYYTSAMKDTIGRIGEITEVGKEDVKVEFEDDFWYYKHEDVEKVEDTSDLRHLLKTGRVVKFRNGKKMLVIKDVDSKFYGNVDIAFVDVNGGFTTADDLDKNLKSETMKGYDIMAIYQQFEDDSAQLTANFLDIDCKNVLVWSRY